MTETTETERTEAERTEAILAGTLHALDAVLLVTVRVARTRDGIEVGAYGLPGIRPDVRRSLLRLESEGVAVVWRGGRRVSPSVPAEASPQRQCVE